MKNLIVALSLAVVGFAAHAADAPASGAKAPTAQQSKMGDCNKEAGDKKGDERKAFMKTCLSAKKDGRAAQNEKMKTCSADFKASGKPGSERKAYMSDCLKK